MANIQRVLSHYLPSFMKQYIKALIRVVTSCDVLQQLSFFTEHSLASTAVIK